MVYAPCRKMLVNNSESNRLASASRHVRSFQNFDPIRFGELESNIDCIFVAISASPIEKQSAAWVAFEKFPTKKKSDDGVMSGFIEFKQNFADSKNFNPQNGWGCDLEFLQEFNLSVASFNDMSFKHLDTSQTRSLLNLLRGQRTCPDPAQQVYSKSVWIAWTR